MANLICDIHFWSFRDDLCVRDTDFSAFRYFDKNHQKILLEKPYTQDKLSFAHGRGQTCFVDGKRPLRLRSHLRELETLLDEQAVVFSEWRGSNFYQLMLSTGLLVNIFLTSSGDIEKITFDKFLVGKVFEHISQVHFSSKFILVTYLASKVTLVTFSKPVQFVTRDENSEKMKSYQSLAHYEPKIQVLDLLGPLGRRLNRQMVVSEDCNQVIFWWSINGNEVYPWAPHLKEEDRANVMIFAFSASHTELRRIGFARTNTEPIALRFVTENGRLGVHYIGQDVTRQNGIQVESVFFDLVDGDRKLRRKWSKKMIHNAEIVSNIFVGEHLVILGALDGTLLLMDVVQHKLECQTKCAFTPNLLKLHHDEGIFIAASSSKGLVQCYDIALSPIRLNFAIDDVITGHILDLSGYFSTSMTLVDAGWCSRKTGMASQPCPMEANALNYLALRFQGGPIVLIRISGGCLSSPSPGSLGPLQVTADYLKHNQFEQALLLLNQLDWKTQGQTLLISIYNVFHKILRRPGPFVPEKETLLEMCLGLFHAPTKPIPEEVIDEFSDQLHDLSRKFFHELLRHHRFTKAFQLAVDLNDYDLFMDIHHAANRLRFLRDVTNRTKGATSYNSVDGSQEAEDDGLAELAEAALMKAKMVFYEEEPRDDDSSSSTESDYDLDDSVQFTRNRIEQLRVSSTPASVSNLTLPEMASYRPPPEVDSVDVEAEINVGRPEIVPQETAFFDAHKASYTEASLPVHAPEMISGPLPEMTSAIGRPDVSTSSAEMVTRFDLPETAMTPFFRTETKLGQDGPISSHHELGIPIVEPSPKRDTVPTFQLTSFSTRNYLRNFSGALQTPTDYSKTDTSVLQRNFNPLDGPPGGSEESSLVSFQSEIAATFLKTTSAKRIATNSFQSTHTTTAEVQKSGSPAQAQVIPELALNEPRHQTDPAKDVEEEDQEDIQVIHFGLV